jgi:hypothetical protein
VFRSHRAVLAERCSEVPPFQNAMSLDESDAPTVEPLSGPKFDFVTLGFTRNDFGL